MPKLPGGPSTHPTPLEKTLFSILAPKFKYMALKFKYMVNVFKYIAPKLDGAKIQIFDPKFNT